MKKLLSIILIVFLLCPCMSACEQLPDQTPSTNQPTATGTGDSTITDPAPSLKIVKKYTPQLPNEMQTAWSDAILQNVPNRDTLTKPSYTLLYQRHQGGALAATAFIENEQQFELYRAEAGPRFPADTDALFGTMKAAALDPNKVLLLLSYSFPTSWEITLDGIEFCADYLIVFYSSDRQVDHGFEGTDLQHVLELERQALPADLNNLTILYCINYGNIDDAEELNEKGYTYFSNTTRWSYETVTE